MRQVLLNNMEVELDDDEAIEIQASSSLFQHEKIIGAFSTTFSIPYVESSKNQLIFQFAKLPYLRSSKINYDFKLQVAGLEMLSGKLVAEKIGDKVEANVLAEGGDFNDQFAEKKLNELNLGKGSFDKTKKVFNSDTDFIAFANFANRGQHDGLPWAHMPEETDGRYPSREHVFLSNYLGSYIKNGLDSYIKYKDGNSSRDVYCFTNCPQVFIRPLVRKILELAGYTLVESFLDKATYKDLVIQSFYDINEWSRPLTAPASFTIAQLLPTRTVKELLKSLQVLFNASLIFSGKEAKLLLNEDVITSIAVKALPASFTLISSQITEFSGVKILQQPDSSDLLHEKFEDASGASISSCSITQEQIDNNEKIDNLPEADYILRNEDDMLYKRTTVGNLGIDVGAGKVELASISAPQPYWFGNDPKKLESQLCVVGRNGGSAFHVSRCNETFVKKTFDNFRIGFVIEGFAGPGLIYQKDGINLMKYNLYDRHWKAWDKWMQIRKKITATLSGSDALMFLLEHSPEMKYSDYTGQKYIFTKVVKSFQGKRILDVKLEGYTVI